MADMEIEIQVQVDNVVPLRELLEQQGTFVGEARQLDEYYSPPDRDFLATRPVSEWLRLRDADGKISMNYKHFYYGADGKSTHCDEYETVIGSIDQARKILAGLNHRLLTRVDKQRASWNYQDYEVSLDHVEGLGDFVEVEYKGDTSGVDPAQVTNQMVAWLKSLAVGTIRRNYVGYPFALLFPDQVTVDEL